MPKYNDFDLDVQNVTFIGGSTNKTVIICQESSVRPTDANYVIGTKYCETMWCTEPCTTHPPVAE